MHSLLVHLTRKVNNIYLLKHLIQLLRGGFRRNVLQVKYLFSSVDIQQHMKSEWVNFMVSLARYIHLITVQKSLIWEYYAKLFP